MTHALAPTMQRNQPKVLAILRIMTGLLMLQFGLVKFVNWPIPFPGTIETFGLVFFAGLIEIGGSLLVILGWWTRAAAFLLSGTMAFAYALGHARHGFFPIANGGTMTILFCFIFLYLVFAGAGAWSLDGRFVNGRDEAPPAP